MIWIIVVSSPGLNPECELIYLMLIYIHLDTAHRHLSINTAEYMELEKCRADDRALSHLCICCAQCIVCTIVYNSLLSHLRQLNPPNYPENRYHPL